MTAETTSFAEGAIEATFLSSRGAIHLPQHPSEPRRLETLQLGLPISSVMQNQRSTSQSMTFAFVTRQRRLSRTDYERKRAKVFTYALSMTMPQIRAQML